MAATKWTADKIARWKEGGRGRGTGASYRPWLEVRDVSSRGRSHRIHSALTGRTHHLLSDVEKALFLRLEWSPDVTDIREQFPLEQDLTLGTAAKHGIRHPYYPGTTVATVMTVDFMVTFNTRSGAVQRAFDAKCTTEAEDPNSIAKLEITRRLLASAGVEHRVIFDTQIDDQEIRNIEWIRQALPSSFEPAETLRVLAEMEARMKDELGAGFPRQTVQDYCHAFDGRYGLPGGTGLRAFRLLLRERFLRADLKCPDLCMAPLASFESPTRRVALRAAG
jgi:hypothetical protein